MTAVPHPRRRRSRYQTAWIVLFWIAAACNLLFLLLALLSAVLTALVPLACGALASTAGAAMASHLSRRGLDDRDFDEVAASMRIVVVGWGLLAVTMVVAAAVGTRLFEVARPGQAAVDAVLAVSESVASQLFGAAALFVVVGDGYTKYRRFLRLAPAAPFAAPPPPTAGPPFPLAAPPPAAAPHVQRPAPAQPPRPRFGPDAQPPDARMP